MPFMLEILQEDATCQNSFGKPPKKDLCLGQLQSISMVPRPWENLETSKHNDERESSS